MVGFILARPKGRVAMIQDAAVLAQSYLQLLSPAAKAAASAKTHQAEARAVLQYLGEGLFLAALSVFSVGPRLASALRQAAPGARAWSRELLLCGGFGLALAAGAAALQITGRRLWPLGAGAAADGPADIVLNGVLIGALSFVTLRIFKRLPRTGWILLAALSAAVLGLALLVTPIAWAPQARGDVAAAPSPAATRILAFVRRGGLAASVLYVYPAGGPRDVDMEGLGPLAHAAVSRAALRAPGPEMFAAAGHLLGHHRRGDLLALFCLLSGCAAGVLFLAEAARRRAEKAGEGGAVPAAALAVWGALLPAVMAFNLFDQAINYRADDFALGLTGDPAALCRWLIKDEAADAAEPSRIESLLFYSHPPLRLRLENALVKPQNPEPL